MPLKLLLQISQKLKGFFFFIILVLPVLSKAQTITSIGSGDWNSVSTWDCSCIPQANDSIVISLNHQVTLSGNITIGSLAIDSGGMLDLSAGGINIQGDWINAGTFIPGSSTVSFTGSGVQSITNSGSGSFFNLVIQKAADNIRLNSDVLVSNNLTLMTGNIILTDYSFTIGLSGSITGGSISSHIVSSGTGCLYKEFAGPGTFIFPVGDSEYTPLTFTLNSGSFTSESKICVQTKDSIHPNVILGNDHINRYWNINSMGFNAIDYDVVCGYSDNDVSGSETDLYAERWDGSSWTKYGLSNTANNTIATNGIREIPLNHEFTAFFPATPLPIKLIDFTAKVSEESVLLEWITASENNNDFFTVERSFDVLDFQPVAIIKGAGSSSSNTYYSAKDNIKRNGIIYYRLKQTDIDGNFTYSGIVSLNLKISDEAPALSVYPNPCRSSESMIINISSFRTLENFLTIRLFDLSGKEVLKKEIRGINGTFISGMNDFQNLKPGIYYIKAGDDRDALTRKILIN